MPWKIKKIAVALGLIVFAMVLSFTMGDESKTALSNITEENPIYSVDTDEKVISLTFDINWAEKENLGSILDILKKYNVKVIGTSIESIKEGEDRELFRNMMNRINEPVITSEIVTDMEAGIAFANKIGYPVIVRPAYTLGGTGGGIAENEDELKDILASGLQLSTKGLCGNRYIFH